MFEPPDAPSPPYPGLDMRTAASTRLAQLFPQPRRPQVVRHPSASDRLSWVVGKAPGPELTAALALIDPEVLDDDERVLLLQAWERVSRWVAARQCDAVVAVAGRAPADRDDVAREQVRVALLGTGGSARHSVDVARQLAGPMRGLRAALQRGELSYDHARVMVQETALMDPAGTMAVTQRVLEDLARRARGRAERVRAAAQRAEDVAAAREGRDPVAVEAEDVPLGAVAGTPGRLRRQVRAAVIRHEPLAAELAAQQAAAERAVSRDVLPDAQAMLRITGPAIGVASIWTALDLRAGRSAADDPRTLDQRRFDALVDLCTEATSGVVASAPAQRPTMPGTAVVQGLAQRPQRRRSVAPRVGLVPGVYVFADAATWAGLADGPVELDGYGPVPAGVAREHFESSAWRVLVTDTVTGAAVAVSDATYRPSVRTRRLLHARDRSCAFPGCHAAIWFCDADHGLPHDQGGCTDIDNCGLLCRRHHRLKTFGRWRWRRLPDGAVEWTDPNGRTWVRYGPTYDLPPPPLPYVDAPPDTDALETLAPARGSPTAETVAEPPPPF